MASFVVRALVGSSPAAIAAEWAISATSFTISAGGYPVTAESFGALSRNSEGAGIAVGGTAITGGNGAGHWTISNGRLYPSASGDSANMNAGPYTIELDNGAVLSIFIESDTWDVATEGEWNTIAGQSQATLKGRTIALRNETTINLGITAVFGTPFRRMDLRDAANGNRPLILKGRFGTKGDWDSYCQIDKIERGELAGFEVEHFKTTRVAETKFKFIGKSSLHADDIVIRDCDLCGEIGDPNGDYSNSANYPNLGIDMVTTGGSDVGCVGNITVEDCRVRWTGTGINIPETKPGTKATVRRNDVSYYYDDGVLIGANKASPQPFIYEDNYTHDPIGLETDSANPHPDAFRALWNFTGSVDWTGNVIRRNIFLPGTSRGVSQAFYFDAVSVSGATGAMFSGDIEDNIAVMNGSGHGISVRQPKNCNVRRNTAVSFDAGSAGNLPAIFVGGSGTTARDGGGNIVSNNIADGFNLGAGTTATGNFTAGKGGATIAYAALFAGPTFAPTSVAEAQALFAPIVDAGAFSA